MVRNLEISLSDISLEDPGLAGSSYTGSFVTPQAQIFPVNSLASERQILKQKGCSDRVILFS